MEIESVAEDYRTFDLAIADEVADRQNGFAEVDWSLKPGKHSEMMDRG